MNPHISDELPRLLTGEANRDAVLSAAEHLRNCVDCQQELVSAVVAHASLTSAQRFAPEIVSGQSAAALSQLSKPVPKPDPKPRPARAESDHDVPPADTDPDLPDLSAVFAQVRAEVDSEHRPPRRSSARRYLVAAAAVVALGGAGAAVWASQSGGNSGAHSGRTVALAAFDAGHTAGSATIKDDHIAVDASSLPSLPDHRYEVWLTNSARTQMQPIGWIGNNGTATLSVPNALMSKYQDLEISVQDTNAKSYSYSGTSVLRGSMD